MAKKAIISTNGNFPAQYNVLQPNADGIYEVVFGPDPDLVAVSYTHLTLPTSDLV